MYQTIYWMGGTRVHHWSYGQSSTRFFSKIASIKKKVLHLKDLNRHLECTDVSFNPENGAFSRMEKWHTDRLTECQTDRLTDWQSDYCIPLAHARKTIHGFQISFQILCCDLEIPENELTYVTEHRKREHLGQKKNWVISTTIYLMPWAVKWYLLWGQICNQYED